MPAYAIVNLLELDDSVAGRVPGLEGRFGRTSLGSRDLGVSHWRYAAGTRAAAATATASRRRPTWSSRAPAACGSTTRCATSGSGTSCASRPRWCARSRPGPTGSS